MSRFPQRPASVGEKYVFERYRGDRQIPHVIALLFQPLRRSASNAFARLGLKLDDRRQNRAPVDCAQSRDGVSVGRRDFTVRLDFDALARTPGTLVFFMGLGRLAEITNELLAHGLDPSTPAAVIASGTTADREVAVAPVAEIVEAAAGLRSPALIVIGDVVSLSERIAAPRGTLAAV